MTARPSATTLPGKTPHPTARPTANLTRASGAAIWSQIESQIAAQIAGGAYAPGARLESEHELAARFGVNRHTIRQALGSLAAKGLVRIRHGSGTFVEDAAIEYVLGRRTRFTENLLKAGVEGRHQLLRASELAAPADIAAMLRVRAGSRLVFMETLGEARGRAMSVAGHYFPRRRFAGIVEAFERTRSISLALRALGVDDFTRNISAISARLPDAAAAALLRQPATRPVLFVESVNVDMNGRPIEFGRSQFAGDLVQLVVQPE